MSEALRERAELIGERALQWISNAVERRTRSENFIVANRTPYDTIYKLGLLSLRRYPPLTEATIEAGEDVIDVRREQYRVPVLLVPPLAADPLNFDLMPHRSLVRFLLAQGFKVYLADFGSPDLGDSKLGLADYATKMLPQAIAEVRRDSGVQDLSLLGYCMGGLFCLVYAGWASDPHLRNLVTIASPIDNRQAGLAGQLMTAMQGPTQLIRRFTSFRIHELAPEKLQIPGWVSSALFKATNPMGVVQGYIDLLTNLWDRDYVIEHQTMSTWFNKMHSYPGGIVQDFLVHVGLDNRLAAGEIELRGGVVSRLKAIEASVLAIAGSTDKIVGKESARKLLDLVGSKDKAFSVMPGGHAGVFAGSRATSATWPHVAQWLASRSDDAAQASGFTREEAPEPVTAFVASCRAR
jgi:polyhydroxyalkanoate synthase